MRTEVKSTSAANNSTGSASVSDWKTLYKRELAKAQFSEKINQFICKVENFVYFCIGNQCNTKHDFIHQPHTKRGSWGNIKSLVLHGCQTERASLFLCTYIK